MAGGLFARGRRPVVKTVEEILLNTYGSDAKVLPLGGEICERGRHLQADAIGMCNMLSVWYWNGKPRVLLDKAKTLAHEVHDVLGRERAVGKRKRGEEPVPPPRLPGASAREPLVGGLRCGRVMSEARASGDGQVWQALVLWAFALNRLAVATDSQEYNHLAAQLLVCVSLKFLQRSLPGATGVHAIEGAVDESAGAGGDGGSSADEAPETDSGSLFNFSPRMSIDLSRPLDAPYRASDPIIGALVCGVVRSGLGPRGDAKIKQSLDNIERRLVQMWGVTSDEQIERLRADPMQVGDLLWAGSWGARRKWGREVGAIAVSAVEGLVAPPSGTPLAGLPLAARYPPGELWMAAGVRNLHGGALRKDTRAAMEAIVDQHGKRLSLWGSLGKMYYPTASFGGVFDPHYVSECNDISYQARNNPAAFTGAMREEDIFKH